MSQTNRNDEPRNWSENDYQIGLNFIRNNEDQANSNTFYMRKMMFWLYCRAD